MQMRMQMRVPKVHAHANAHANACVNANAHRRRSAPALLLPYRLVISAGMLQRVVPERRLECLPARFGHIGSHHL